MYRWATAARMTKGMVAIAEAALMSAYWTLNSCKKLEIPTVIVWASGVDVKESAIKNSFQVNMATRIDTAAMPGAASGTITLQKTPPSLQPSTKAASFRSSGMLSKVNLEQENREREVKDRV